MKREYRFGIIIPYFLNYVTKNLKNFLSFLPTTKFKCFRFDVFNSHNKEILTQNGASAHIQQMKSRRLAKPAAWCYSRARNARPYV
jgi:hypothetical protein